MVSPRSRQPWIDHLRTWIIILVVNMHACVTYSHVGDWYAMSAHEPTMMAKIPFIVWQGHLQSFFMGLLFFISGYFADGSLSRRGPGGFVRERLVRLGLPALLYMLVIHPFIVCGLNPWDAKFAPPLTFYFNYLKSGRFLSASGPLWFVIALLIFCLGLVWWRAWRPRAAASPPQPSVRQSPATISLWVLGLGLGLATFLIRTVLPIGTNVANLQLCFFAQYIAFFAAGVHAAQAGWLPDLIAAPHARRAGWLAVIGGPPLLLTVIFFGTKDNGSPELFFGGWHWQAFAFAFWEQLAGLGLALGSLAFFASHMNRDTASLRWLAERSFGVYVLHAPVLVALFMLYRSLPPQPWVLIPLLTVTGLVASYVLADVARRLPGLKKIL